ncbi:kynurenine formamidase [Lipingzhangella halophila]|uniref:Kynurenine formamidase n=1 Tax=Lipingzhangella halophila TaxID=1783352 RepID=A0A7W7RIC0_9ACTN|nr:cyclase family protein [Lipingzhangella halophila]MBB4932556.1 kynurenine formamidase [Lipingzhangella halophila]
MRVRRIVDLSRPIGPETQPYPGDPAPRITTAATVADSGFHSVRVEMGSHSATHADAPFHFLEDGARLDELPLELFTGPAVVVDVTGHGDRTPIGRSELAPWAERFGPGVVVLLHTGWSAHYRTERYLAHPYLAQDAVRLLVDRGVRTIGTDCLSPDETPHGEHSGGDWPAHRAVLGAGGTIIENLCHLDRIDFPRPWFSAFPIRLASDDGAPVRAVAMSLGD